MASRVARKSALVALALVSVTIMLGGATAQSGCTSALMGLAPCLGFIQGGSSNPSSSCCSGLSKIVQNQAACLCQVLNGGGSSFGITINQTQALALPGACKVQTPPASQCNAVNKQAAGPAASPVGSPDDAFTPEAAQADSPSFSSTPSAGVGSKSTKSGSTSDGNMTKSPLHFTLLLLFITSAASVIISI